MFKALVVREEEGTYSSRVEALEESMLGVGDLLVKVLYSTLNYKDGMVIKGLGRLVREYPHIPGVDLVGEVLASDDGSFDVGRHVIVTGFRMGEIHFGGFSELARVPHEWAVPLPDGLDPRDAMAIGTAGLTSMLALMALEQHGAEKDRGPVLVTGAAGGVGSTAVALLSSNGYDVAAATGRREEEVYLRSLGATSIVDRAELSEPTTKPLEGERFNGAVDSVGGSTLARLLGQVNAGSSVAAVGLAAGPTFHGSVIPFLLRGINLLGIESVMAPLHRRVEAWERIASEMPLDLLRSMVVPAELEELPRLAEEILAGRIRGRVVVAVGS